MVAEAVEITGFDGEPIPYTQTEGWLVGPCPVCYARNRLRMAPADAAAHSAPLQIPVGVQHAVGALPRRRDGSYKRMDEYPIRHIGCFEGLVVETPSGLAWHRAPHYKDLGLYWSR